MVVEKIVFFGFVGLIVLWRLIVLVHMAKKLSDEDYEQHRKRFGWK